MLLWRLMKVCEHTLKITNTLFFAYEPESSTMALVLMCVCVCVCMCMCVCRLSERGEDGLWDPSLRSLSAM